jgi:hypothetical protein
MARIEAADLDHALADALDTVQTVSCRDTWSPGQILIHQQPSAEPVTAAIRSGAARRHEFLYGPTGVPGIGFSRSATGHRLREACVGPMQRLFVTDAGGSVQCGLRRLAVERSLCH